MDHPPESLLSRLEILRCRNAHRHWFIPEQRLHELLSKEAIQTELLAAGIRPYRADELSEHVLKHGTKIFGVLVLIQQVAATPSFVEERDFQDTRLPFSQDLLNRLLSPIAAKKFEEHQWEVIVPTFERGTIHRSLPPEIVLPFIKDERVGRGAFGNVFEIEIMQGHQHIEEAFQRKLVRKELEDSSDHRVELENLAILSHLRHPNIVELLASYTHDGKHNLIFPLAEGGTLEDHFVLDRQTTSFASDATLLVAIARLASAIEQVHGFIEDRVNIKLIGCHYDLRPKNILVSGDRLVLADFGLSRFKEITESSATEFKSGAGNYRAPECEDIDDEQFIKHQIRRSSDIWSFGCILAEIITYMVYGSVGVKRFKEIRGFKQGKVRYYLFHCGPNKPNEAVENFLSQLECESLGRCRTLLELIYQMLSMDERERPKAQEVTGTLRLIALCKVVELVNELLDNLPLKTSLDALIEHTRFQSWRYALGISDRQSSAEFPKQAGGWQDSKFELMLDSLYRVRHLLSTLSCQPQSATIPTLYRLTKLNDHLYEALDEQLQEKSRLYFKTFILQAEDFPALQQVRDGMSSASLPVDIRMLVSLKHMTTLAMSYPEEDTCQRQVDVTSVKIVSAFGDHNLGIFQKDTIEHPVLVEWRQYGRQSADEAVNQELLIRTDAVAELLGREKPEEFRGLNCKGFFNDLNKFAFGLIYDYPRTTASCQGVTCPDSLRSLLEHTFDDYRRHPALDDRFRVASILCRSVSEFHSVGWLHKRLSSSNVAFFPTSKLLEDEWFHMPYIVGFSHSRPDEISAFTSGPEDSGADHYQHPLYRTSKRYCREYDYYSLGVVLLEIGLWRTLNDMTKNYNGTHEQFRQQLIQKRLPLLKQLMGRSYYEVVKTCLEGNFEASELNSKRSSDVESLHLEFNTVIVHRLEKLCGGF